MVVVVVVFYQSDPLDASDIKLTFQSIRMHINREIYEISTGAKAAWSMLGIGGRLCIIVFKPPEREAVERSVQLILKDAIFS